MRELVTKLVIEMYTNLPTSQGYIFRILQHFATKLCSFSNFDNFFPKISFVIPRLKIFLKRKSSIQLRLSRENRQNLTSKREKHYYYGIVYAFMLIIPKGVKHITQNIKKFKNLMNSATFAIELG